VDIITSLVLEISLLPGVLYLFDLLCPVVIEVEMFAFLALTLEMFRLEKYRMKWSNCAVILRTSNGALRILSHTSDSALHNGRNGVDRMDESRERQWTI